MALYVCSPVLSMIDTATVGLLAGTEQQAALLPAVALADYSSRLLYFLFTGTTSILAKNNQQQADRTAAEQLRHSLRLALWVGAGSGLALGIFCRPLLHYLFLGNKSTNSVLLDTATQYVQVRALGLPAAAMVGTAQAACVAWKDVRSPLRVVLWAGILNGILDVMLVRWTRSAVGASWATIVAQYGALLLLLRWFRTAPTADEQGTATTKTTTMDAKQSVTTRGILARTRSNEEEDHPIGTNRKSRGTQQRLFPSKETRRLYRPFVVPVTMTQIGRCAVYVAMGNTVSSTMGTASLAAQQIICSVFYALIPIADSLSLAAQSFLPALYTRQESNDENDKVLGNRKIRQALRSFLRTALWLGLGLTAVTATLPWTVRWFTTDLAILKLVHSIVPYLISIFFFHGIFCGAEGILLAQNDLKFLGRMYAVYCAVVPCLMLRVKWRAQAGVSAASLQSVWTVFLGYQAFRITAWVSRVAWLQRRRECGISQL